jgi:uncharacterized RmlC-like cupin family protein
MKAGHMAKAHIHHKHDIIVSVLYGHVMSLLGDNLVGVQHGPGDSIHIPAGEIHCGINLMTDQPAVLLECRTDPYFNADVIPLPDLDARVRRIGLRHQRAFHTPPGTLSVLDRLLASNDLASAA